MLISGILGRWLDGEVNVGWCLSGYDADGANVLPVTYLVRVWVEAAICDYGMASGGVDGVATPLTV